MLGVIAFGSVVTSGKYLQTPVDGAVVPLISQSKQGHPNRSSTLLVSKTTLLVSATWCNVVIRLNEFIRNPTTVHVIPVRRGPETIPVSYTHLTLPTNRE